MPARTLLLIRHAKAVDDAPSDAARPLAGRGRRDAAAAGRWLAELGISPGLALVSPAVRAQQTWAEIEAAVGGGERRTEPTIYANSVDELIDLITGVDDGIETLALVGHNPSMHGLALTLDDGHGDEEARTAIQRDYPTCAITVYDVTVTWRDVAYGTATLRAFAAPRAQ